MSIVWYIRPDPGVTSEELGRLVGDENICYEVRCADGRKRNLYRVPWSLLNDALRMDGPFRFTVWKQQGATPPKPFDPTSVFRGRRDPKVREIGEKLSQQLARKSGKTAQK